MFALIFALLSLTHATTEQELVDGAAAAHYQLRRANSPTGLPPVGFLVRERVPTLSRTLPQLLWEAGGVMGEDTFRFDLQDLKGSPGTIELFGPYSAFLAFLRRQSSGYALLMGDLRTDLRARLVSHLGQIIRIQRVTSAAGEKIPLRNNALLVEASDLDLIARGMTVGALRSRAEYTVELDGYRLDLYSGLKLRTLLVDCAATLDEPPAGMPPLLPGRPPLIR